MQLSSKIIEFFLDVELVTSSSNSENFNCVFKKLSYSTNEYHGQFYLRYSSLHDLSAIEQELQEILSDSNHNTESDIMLSLIALFSLLNKKQRNEQSIRSFFQIIIPIKIKQYLFFPALPEGVIHGLKFNDFEIGQISYSKFSNFIKNHSGSDYAIRYEAKHKDGVGIEMKSRTIYSFDVYKWMVLSGENIITISRPTEEIVNYYLNHLALISYSSFKNEFHKQQYLLNSLFGVTISLNEFEYLGFQFVNVFYNFSGSAIYGWVLPINWRVGNIVLPDSRVLKRVNKFLLKEENKINEIDSEFNRLKEIVIELFSRGQKNINNGNFGNAYIDYFVGLDFLLAPDTEKSKKLKQRIALLTHRGLGVDFAKHLERLDYLYDIRSEYVHNGKSVDTDALVELRNISRIVILILIRLHKRCNGKVKAYEQWLSQIDILVQGIYKGVKANIEAYSKVGVGKIDTEILSKDLSDKQDD